MQWLLDLADEYRSLLRRGPFYKALAAASCPADIKGWVRQLYYQSREFTSALAMRYGVCHDPHFQGCFAQHAMDEADHPEQLIDWMSEHTFLSPDEHPTSVPATLDTLAVNAYCFRAVIREPIAHQVIALNLMSEGVAFDFYSAVIPKLKSLNLHTGRYWQIHKEVDREHLVMGFDLIPQCEPDSIQGQAYARIVWEMASLYGQMLDSWSGTSIRQKIEPPATLGTAATLAGTASEPNRADQSKVSIAV